MLRVTTWIASTTRAWSVTVLVNISYLVHPPKREGIWYEKMIITRIPSEGRYKHSSKCKGLKSLMICKRGA